MPLALTASQTMFLAGTTILQPRKETRKNQGSAIARMLPLEDDEWLQTELNMQLTQVVAGVDLHAGRIRHQNIPKLTDNIELQRSLVGEAVHHQQGYVKRTANDPGLMHSVASSLVCVKLEHNFLSQSLRSQVDGPGSIV
eukprot:4329795-Amphidinium_carterae.1